jgi:hypothetical protein
VESCKPKSRPNGQIYMAGPVEGVYEGCFHQDIQKQIKKNA